MLFILDCVSGRVVEFTHRLTLVAMFILSGNLLLRFINGLNFSPFLQRNFCLFNCFFLRSLIRSFCGFCTLAGFGFERLFAFDVFSFVRLNNT